MEKIKGNLREEQGRSLGQSVGLNYTTVGLLDAADLQVIKHKNMLLPIMVSNASDHNIGWERDGTIHAHFPAAQTVAARAVSTNSVHPP